MRPGMKSAHDPNKPKVKFKPSMVAIFTILGALPVIVLSFMLLKLHELSLSNDEIRANIAILEPKLKEQINTNLRIVGEDKVYEDPAGKLGLLDGKITFTLPEGWARTTASNCSGGSRDSDVLCYDIVAITPEGSSAPQLTAEIAVFEHKEDDGNAQSWYETRYDGTPLVNYSTPSVSHLETRTLRGDSTMSFQMVRGNEADPADINTYSVIIHGKYAVVLRARIQYDGAYPGTEPYDHRDTYLPILQQIFESIQFEE